jgi:hypothetical protein
MILQTSRVFLLAVAGILSASAALARPVTVAWDPNPESDIAGYVVRYGTQPRNYTASVDVGKKTTCSLTLLNDRTYYLAVEAYNTGGLRSPLSAEVSVKASAGRLTIDTPRNNSVVTAPLSVTGWAIDSGATFGTGVDVVQVWAYPFPGSGRPPIFVGAGTYGVQRADVAAAFGSQFRASGFNVTLTNLPPAPYQLRVFGRSTITGAFSSAAVNMRVSRGPILQVDTPLDMTNVWPIFNVSGWAVDLRAPTGTGVDAVKVYATPLVPGATSKFIGNAPYGTVRPDVGAAFGSRFGPSAFGITVSGLEPGTYDIVTYAHSTFTGAYNLVKSTRVTVGALMAIDAPLDKSTIDSSATIAGWSADLRAPIGTGIDAVHVWAYPESGAAARFLGVAAYGFTRPDIGNLFGRRFEDSAWRLPITGLPRGNYRIVAFGHSTVTGAFDAAREIKVTVR